MWSLMNTDEEKHAVLIGFCETACPLPARYRVTEKSEYGAEKEHHYYLFGRVLGLICLSFFSYGIYRLFTW